MEYTSLAQILADMPVQPRSSDLLLALSKAQAMGYAKAQRDLAPRFPSGRTFAQVMGDAMKGKGERS